MLSDDERVETVSTLAPVTVSFSDVPVIVADANVSDAGGVKVVVVVVVVDDDVVVVELSSSLPQAARDRPLYF